MTGLRRNRGARLWRRLARKPLSALAVLVLTVIWAPFGFTMSAASASTGVLAGGFEIDGNLTAGDLTPVSGLDWTSATVGTQPKVADPINQAENSVYYQGSQITDPPSDWHVSTTAGQGGKDDIGYVYEYNHTGDYTDPQTSVTSSHEFAYVGFERASNNGTTHFDVEFNQNPDVMNTDNTALVPDRANNDILVQITQLGSGSFDITGTAYKWDSSTSAWVAITPSPWIVGLSNTSPIEPISQSDPVAVDDGTKTGHNVIPAGQFAEVSIDLTGLIGLNQGCPGETFGAMNMRSWSANPDPLKSPELKDYISPLGVHIPSSCADLKIEKFAADGTTHLNGATFTVTPNPATGTGSIQVVDGGTTSDSSATPPLVADPDGTANGVIEFTQAKPNIDYSVTETAPPPGYTFGPTLTKTSGTIDSFGSADVTFKDYLGSVTWTKVDDATGDALCCATFELTGGANNIDIFVTDNGTNDENSTAGTLEVTGLQTGDYTLTETHAPTGYSIPKTGYSQTFTITTAYVDRDHTLSTAFRDPHVLSSLWVKKTDVTDSTALGGAGFSLFAADGSGDPTGSAIDSCTTSTAANATTADPLGYCHVSNIDFGSYVWVEESAPQGYVLPNPKPQSSVVTVTAANAGTITIADAKVFTDTRASSSLTVEKLDATDKSPLNGATFTLYPSDSSGNYTVGDPNAQSCVTGSGSNPAGECTISGLGFGYYEWVETTAPTGYDKANPDHQGPIQIDATNAGGTFDITTFSDPRKLTDLTVEKLDATSHGPLAGAIFELLDSQDNLVGNNNPCTTGTNGTCTVTDVPFGTYHWVEMSAPQGYDLPASTTSGDITIDATNAGTTLDPTVFSDPRKLTDVPVEKTDATTGAPLAGAVFELRDAQNNVVGNNDPCTTDQTGVCTVTDVPFGTYHWVETKAPTGYNLPDPVSSGDITIDATNAGTTLLPTVFSDPQKPSTLTVKKTAADTGLPLPGATFDLHQVGANNSDTIVGTCTTGSDGTCSVPVDGFGTFYWVETQAPDNYTIPTDHTSGTITIDATNAGTTLGVTTFSDPPTGALSIAKGATPAPNSSVQFGDTITYSLVVTATKTAQQTGVVVTDFIPGYDPSDVGPTGTQLSGKTTYVGGSATCSTSCSASYNAAAHELTWNVGTLDPASAPNNVVQVTLTYQVTVDRPAATADGGIPAEVIDNVAVVTSDQQPAELSNVVHHFVTAVLGVKIIKTPPVKATKLPFTGMGLPVGPASTVAIALVGAGTALVSMTRRRRPVGKHRLTS